MTTDEMGKIEGGGAYRRVEVKRVLNAPIAKVWDAISNIENVRQWWADGNIEPWEGGRIVLQMDEEDCEGNGLPLNGTIKIFQPPHILEFTWNDKYKPAMGLVRFDLAEAGSNKTILTIVQSVPAVDAASAAAGWQVIVETLHLFATNETLPSPTDTDARYRQLQSEYRAAHA